MKKKGKIEKLLNNSLMKIVQGYRLFRRTLKKTKQAMPEVYGQIDNVLKQNLVTFERNNQSFSDAIVDRLIRKLPTLGEEKLTKIINGGSSKSFFDMLNKSLGATLEEEKDYTKLEKEKLFNSILIANRGEIALRIIRACKELGIKVYVIYSKPEKNTLFVKFADKAYCIGNPRDYLNIRKIIKIAKKAKADAIHPGYGYLSENSQFAKLCLKNKINFIGPNIKALELMGNKVKARKIISKMGINVIAGTVTPLKNLEDAQSAAQEIGYPVILKAALGGGGKGMRVVYSGDKLETAFKSASTEAQAAFGDHSLYMEKYIEKPKHIEFQILADKFKNIVHLGERDCSIQRRHQKLIEEAPSTVLNGKLREKIGKDARRIASKIGYKGAGTVEFLLDKRKNYYFMEMNARIQVEHGITEMISGVDLVKEQIRIAAGGKLTYKQEDIKLNGWAIECRINAENPFDDFKPSTGIVTNYLPPGGRDIRISSHSYTGHVISHHYDPLISNLICGGKNRNEAIARMKRALEEYIIEGVQTNIPFHKLVMQDKDFIKGNISTDFIEKNKIIEKLRKHKIRKKELSKKEKLLIITTAVSRYMEGRENDAPDNWVIAGRQEQLNQNV